ncbi:MAG: hypothetical protein ACFFG0_04800 [Candidatus Thorarchaeota archaeon]
MWLETKSDRVKACFECKEYTFIYPESAENREFLRWFEHDHRGHMVQTINLSEIDKNIYKVYKRK